MLHCEAFLHPRTSAQFLEAIPESRLPATGSIQRVFPGSQSQPNLEGRGVTPSTKLGGIAEVAKPAETVQNTRQNGGIASELKASSDPPAKADQAVRPTPATVAAAEKRILPKSLPSSSNEPRVSPKAGSSPQPKEAATLASSPVDPPPRSLFKLAVPATTSVALEQRTTLVNDISSDSEGPLPEIDSGDSSNEEDNEWIERNAVVAELSLFE